VENPFNASTLFIRVIVLVNGENGEFPNVTIFSDAFHMMGNMYLPATYIYATQFAYFRGDILIGGAVNIGGTGVMEHGNITVVGEVNIGYNNVGQLVSNTSYLSLDHVAFTTDDLKIGFNGTLEVEFFTSVGRAHIAPQQHTTSPRFLLFW